jgi:hypothetical protein
MPLEPKKPIEELLEASARARRAEFGADPKMPNPMRAELHHEIARLARNHEQRSGHFFGIPWPRLALGAAFALILVSASGLWWWRERQAGGRETLKLAMQEPTREAPPPEKVFEQGAVAAGPAAPTFADSNAATSRPAEEAKDADALTKSAGATTAPSTTGARTEGLMAAGAKTDEPLPANKSLPAKEAPAAPASALLAQNRQLTNFRQQPSQNAAKQAFRGKFNKALNILNEFQVEQTDHEIRVVDADGSTYSGKLEPLAQNDARSVFNQKQNYSAPASHAASSFDEKAQSTNAEFYFRASGYNSSLKKPLVFEGNYIASSVAQKKVAKAKAEAEERDEQTPARITGTAKIRGESPVQIDAIAVAK